MTVGTVFEHSKIPLNKWVLASHLMAASKKGMSAHRMYRTLGITYKTAWFMCHRIREAMKEDVADTGPLGGEGKIVEARDAVREILVATADCKSTLYTDESNLYPIAGQEFAKHDTVKHSAKEYARGDVPSNTVENVFSVFNRGMVGVYQHYGEAHLHRYLAEFDFRYNRRAALKFGDAERAEDLLGMTRDKRLTYRRIGEAANA